jgi:hypothetical protein
MVQVLIDGAGDVGVFKAQPHDAARAVSTDDFDRGDRPFGDPVTNSAPRHQTQATRYAGITANTSIMAAVSRFPPRFFCSSRMPSF